MLTPLARRTFAPKGQTPIQKCWARRGRISVISAVSVSPRSERLGLSFRMLPANTGAKAEDTVAFLNQLRRRYRGPLTICWDRGQIHDKSKAVWAWLSKHPEVVTERFPGYAPELNPDEYVWTHTKYTSLCNYCAPDLPALGERVEAALIELGGRPRLLQSFIDHTHLKWKKPKSKLRSRNQ